MRSWDGFDGFEVVDPLTARLVFRWSGVELERGDWWCVLSRLASLSAVEIGVVVVDRDCAQNAVSLMRGRGRLAIEIEAIWECSDRTVRNSGRLAENDIDASVGSKGDSYDSALVESFNVARTS